MAKKPQPKENLPKKQHEPFCVWRVVRVKGGDYALCTYKVDNGELIGCQVSVENLQAIILSDLEHAALSQIGDSHAKDLETFTGY